MLITLLAMLDSEEDRRILSALYEENHDRMEQTAIRILNDPRDAEDAVQNAFIKVIGSYEKIFAVLFAIHLLRSVFALTIIN